MPLLLVESGVKGGALITADIANSYNRDVLAVPGRPDDQWSAGCNSLIRNNKAALVESADDIEYFLNWKSEKSKPPVQRSLFSELDENEKLIYELLVKQGEMNIDAICRISRNPGLQIIFPPASDGIQGSGEVLSGKFVSDSLN